MNIMWITYEATYIDVGHYRCLCEIITLHSDMTQRLIWYDCIP